VKDMNPVSVFFMHLPNFPETFVEKSGFFHGMFWVPLSKIKWA
jgi:hypothetical protein